MKHKYNTYKLSGKQKIISNTGVELATVEYNIKIKTKAELNNPKLEVYGDNECYVDCYHYGILIKKGKEETTLPDDLLRQLGDPLDYEAESREVK